MLDLFIRTMTQRNILSAKKINEVTQNYTAIDSSYMFFTKLT